MSSEFRRRRESSSICRWFPGHVLHASHMSWVWGTFRTCAASLTPYSDRWLDRYCCSVIYPPVNNYTMSQKKQDTNSCPQLPQMLTDLQNSFTDRLSGKFATNSYLNIPPHPKCVATLPCEISMFKNRHTQEVIEANCHVRLIHSKNCF